MFCVFCFAREWRWSRGKREVSRRKKRTTKRRPSERKKKELRREESCVAKRAASRRELRHEESCAAKRAASRRELRREKSCVACCLCAMLGLALAVVTRKVAPFESATQRGRSRMRKGAIGV